jgi:hypothetical protein
MSDKIYYVKFIMHPISIVFAEIRKVDQCLWAVTDLNRFQPIINAAHKHISHAKKHENEKAGQCLWVPTGSSGFRTIISGFMKMKNCLYPSHGQRFVKDWRPLQLIETDPAIG